MIFIFSHHPHRLFIESIDTGFSHSLVSRYWWSCSVMQKNARLQPLQAVIQVISLYCFHLGQISFQILCWMLWRNCLHLTCKWHFKSITEEMKYTDWNYQGEQLSTRWWSRYHFYFFFNMMHFSIACFAHPLKMDNRLHYRSSRYTLAATVEEKSR